ncbi:hypothetical protein TCAL_11005 [Tigriopus californicus]|uniref:Rab5-interacting protein n=1 Tax=Tigriopus californicus TaxID=6832 RepID=A0A553PPT0_TIGCA|nr:GEL complex subunit OPTI-like [Tigriopus californicus]XP_059084770.1 GEL complex subunit OPTI-like [Tigriopus californicus]TRY79694.1 hypothetical protein TCAL_11005 [Tigriopus californicus]
MPSAWTGGGSSSSPASVSATSGSSSSSVIGLIGQALTANSEWAEKDDFLDVIYWARQILGVLLGLVFGLLGVTGAIGLIGFAAGNAGALYAYWTLFQGVDEEEYGGAWEMTKEGFMTSLAGFLVCWIILYSGLHYD